MLLVLLFILITAIGIGLCVYYEKSCSYNDYLFASGIGCVFIGGFALIISLALIITTQLQAEINFENKIAERDMIIYRIEKGEEIAGNELLYTQIVDFNNELRVTKKYANSLWTNWFNNARIADEVDYIELE